MNINLACGSVFVTDTSWRNLHYASSSPAVQRANLLGHLPFEDSAAELVYSFHFLEHIPLDQVAPFLQECWRILKPGGVLRIVVPDLENLCRTYLYHRDQGEHDLADFLVLELLDQCVRRQSGGELGRYYRSLKAHSEGNTNSVLFVRERMGEDLLHSPPPRRRNFRSILRRLPAFAERLWIRAVNPVAAARLPRTEREPGQPGRVPSLALRRPQPASVVACQWLRVDQALHGLNQSLSRFPLPSARPGCRWPAAQRCRVAVHRSAEAWLTPIAPATSAWGGRHG